MRSVRAGAWVIISSDSKLDDSIAGVHGPLRLSRGAPQVQCGLVGGNQTDEQLAVSSTEAVTPVQLVAESVDFLVVLRPASGLDCGGEEAVCVEDVGHVVFLLFVRGAYPILFMFILYQETLHICTII
tara:strand:- start:897 stop:1280 length:384 start_codon:yes stop_codon:yes gene_type:complete